MFRGTYLDKNMRLECGSIGRTCRILPSHFFWGWGLSQPVPKVVLTSPWPNLEVHDSWRFIRQYNLWLDIEKLIIFFFFKPQTHAYTSREDLSPKRLNCRLIYRFSFTNLEAIKGLLYVWNNKNYIWLKKQFLSNSRIVSYMLIFWVSQVWSPQTTCQALIA